MEGKLSKRKEKEKIQGNEKLSPGQKETNERKEIRQRMSRNINGK